MTSILSMALRLVIPVAVVLGVPGEARAQIVITFAPPAAYIATSQPEYFAGRPVYWYNNAWYYRDHNRWHHYQALPVDGQAQISYFTERSRAAGRRDPTWRHWYDRYAHTRSGS